MHPCIRKPKGFSLSYPSICHAQSGPLEKHLRRQSACFLRISTPCGSVAFTITCTFSLLTLYRLCIHLWDIARQQIQQPLEVVSISINLITSTNGLEKPLRQKPFVLKVRYVVLF